jgi:hypothetical protein
MKVKCAGYWQGRENYFTVGKIYDVIDGAITSDDGFYYDGTQMAGHPNSYEWLAHEYYKFEEVKDMKNYELHITSDGVNTNAVYKVDGKIVNKAKARCNPEDEFDFKTGAEIATERVLETKEPYNAKVICVENDESYGENNLEIGAIYTIRDNCFVWHNGIVSASKYNSIEDLNKRFVCAKFIEYKGGLE